MKTNNFRPILTNFTIALLSLGVVFGYYSYINIKAKAQNTSERILIETKSNIKVPNDTRLDNNEAIVRDYIIKSPTTSSSTSTSSVSIFSNPNTNKTINEISLLGYAIRINDDNSIKSNSSSSSAQSITQNNPYNPSSNTPSYLLPDQTPTKSDNLPDNPLVNAVSNLPLNLSPDQIKELQEYAFAAGDGWRSGKLYISNPIEAARLILKYPSLAKYVVSNLIRTGGQQLSLQSGLIPLILFVLLISSIANLVNKKLTYNTK